MATVTAFLWQVGDTPRKGWGFVPVAARLGNTKWQTTLFLDKERGYLIDIKADVRKKVSSRKVVFESRCSTNSCAKEK